MADEEFLPFAQNSFDLVVSSLRYGTAIKFHRMRFYSLFVIIVRARWCTGQLVRHLIMDLEGWGAYQLPEKSGWAVWIHNGKEVTVLCD